MLLDGNGIFHNKECGMASHFGVLADIPTIGCGKTVFSIDGLNERLVKKLSE